jgi:hypothetical protein
MRITIIGLCALLVTSAGIGLVQAQQQSPQERVAALKGNLAASQAALRQYEWIETTVISLKGEEKSRQQNRCYHGADGVLQKVPVAAPPPAEKKRGLRGKIVENKKEELADYMKEAVSLVRQYVPPDPARIQAVKDAGHVTLQPDGTGKRLRLTFAGYLKPGDSLGVDVDLASNSILGLKVATYLASPQEAATLDVRFATLSDGASYPSNVTLDAQAKNLTVAVQNSGYRKLAP